MMLLSLAAVLEDLSRRELPDLSLDFFFFPLLSTAVCGVCVCGGACVVCVCGGQQERGEGFMNAGGQVRLRSSLKDSRW
jgi:hypothetical protein